MCTYQTNASDVSAIDLFVPGSDTRWATVLAGTVHSALPKTDDGQPVLSIDTPGARIRAEGRLSAIPFQLARPRVFGGIAAPNADQVSVTSVTAAGLTLAITKPAHFASKALVQEGAGCGDVVVARPDWSATSVLPDTSSAKRGLLVTGIAIPVRETEAGAPVGELSFPKKRLDEPGGWQSISVLETSKSSSRIVFRESWGAVFGWVPTTAVKPVPKPTKAGRLAALREAGEFGMIGLLAGTPSPPAVEPPPRERVTCRHEVPLIVEVGAKTVTVGAIAPGVPLVVGSPRGETARLFSAPPGLNPMEAARFFVPTQLLDGCARAPALDGTDPSTEEE